ncbi:MAG: helix-turn-helix domain-containing protein [Acidobacteriota bacterium]|nr:helix-turn-helix domain-containing protein [Acidobacteriota bacterium]
MEKQILVADEVAEMLRVDRQRVYELVRRHAIPVIRLGERQYRFDAEAIKRWMTRGGTVEGKQNDEGTSQTSGE